MACVALMTVTVMVGCGQHANNATVTNHTGSALKKEVAVQETATNTGDEGAEAVDEFAGELFILEELDMTEETLSLYQISTGKQLRYKYNMTTRFLDKYGKNSTWAEFTIGSVVNISGFLPS